ncbi:hypothetical protein ACKI1Q_44090, partial [Streptomyces galilaeus]|uniref:hypothetical protein n=1 Tax=Streptomyces galilaeus TaxID=33899 RepID=UPI0038F6735D
MNSNHIEPTSRTHIQNFALMMQVVASVLSISFTVLTCAIVYWQVEAQLTPMFKGVEYQRVID